METPTTSYAALISKLDEFVRKFYKNQLIRGLFYAAGILLTGFLLLTLLEHFAHFDILVRTILFWTFLLATCSVLARLVFYPIFKLNRIGKIISHDDAAKIIGKHFIEVQDKLLNILQLRRADFVNGTSAELIQASIDQKIRELKPISFVGAIDLSKNRKYAKFALVPLLVLLAIIFINAGVITDSANRLAHPGEFFEASAPFKFEIQNKTLKGIENDDFSLDVKLSGKEIPESVFILVDGNEYKLSRSNPIQFNYVFRNIQNSKKFRFFADGHKSKEYTIEVMPNPIVLNFEIELQYPKYTNKKNEKLKNTGDLIVPCGTNIIWNFNTHATTRFLFTLGDSTFNLNATSTNAFAFTHRFLDSKNYFLHTANNLLKSKDSIHYSISVIPDLFPSIAIEEKKDTLSRLRLYFNGEVKDDYGFTALSFNYTTQSKKDSTGKDFPAKTTRIKIPINMLLQRDQFYYYWDLSKIGLELGEEIEYYFEVCDNDGIHGAKTTRTQKMIYKAPTEKELKNEDDRSNKKTESDLEASLAESKSLQKDIEDMYKKLMEKNALNWEDKKKIEELKNRQEELKEKIEKIKQQQQQNAQQQNEFPSSDPETELKKEELQKLFDQLATDEMKKMIAQLEALLKNADKDKMQKALDEMKQENKDAQKDIDRTLNLFRDLQVQKKMDDVIKELNKMQQQQDSLAKQSSQKNTSKEDQKENKAKQDSLNKKFEEFRKKMDELEQANKKLDNPHNIPNTDLKEMEVQKQQRESSESQKAGASKKASESQKKASDKMQELSSELQSAQNEMNEEQASEDMQAIRQLLSNLIKLSFDQEALMAKVKTTSINDPQYISLARTQKKLRDDSKLIEDSLLALSKRNPKISPQVNKEITNINMNMDRAQSSLGERNTSEARNREQQAMASVNNLALLLNEALEAMMAEANAQNKAKCSGGVCKKPGNGKKNKPGMSSLRSMQEGLNQQMKAIKQGGKAGSAEQLAKMAAQQAYIRQMLQEAMKEGNDKGGGQTQSKMEETETDLVNKRVTAETIKRQQEILDKMLDYEKAEKQKEMDEQRQSNEAKSQEQSNPNGFLEYNKQKQKEEELLRTLPPAMSPFYKNKVNTYFNGVELNKQPKE